MVGVSRGSPKAEAVSAVDSSGVPQVPQNRWPGGFDAPHEAQSEASGFPHSPQNRWPGGFSVPHRWQRVSLEDMTAEGYLATLQVPLDFPD